MEKIEGIELDELVSDVASELVNDRRKQAASAIKVQLQKVEQLAADMKLLNKQLKEKQKKFDEVVARIEKIKGGDWSLLAEPKDGQDSNKQDKE
jgi:seryl-tRNA synthetase